MAMLETGVRKGSVELKDIKVRLGELEHQDCLGQWVSKPYSGDQVVGAGEHMNLW